MAEHVDYVSPMVYPSHWGPGEYGVADPNAPAVRHRAALAGGLPAGRPRDRRARRAVAAGLLARRRRTGPPQVRAQIRAARDAGIDEYLLWDPAVTYTAGALTDRMRRTAVFSKRKSAGGGREGPEAERARARAGADAPPDPRRRRRVST